jgi:hypothetical protein
MNLAPVLWIHETVVGGIGSLSLVWKLHQTSSLVLMSLAGLSLSFFSLYFLLVRAYRHLVLSPSVVTCAVISARANNK